MTPQLTEAEITIALDQCADKMEQLIRQEELIAQIKKEIRAQTMTLHGLLQGMSNIKEAQK